MTDVTESSGAEIVPTVADDEPLLRLLWRRHDIDDDGTIVPEAITLQDLEGPTRGYSVDRESMADEKVMTALMNYQKPRAQNVGEREEAFLSRIASAGAVRALKDLSGEQPFIVVESPTQQTEHLPANPAHAHIASREKSRSKRLERRQLLLRVLETPIPFADYFNSADDADD